MTLEAFLATFFDRYFGRVCDAACEGRHGHLLSKYLRESQKECREIITQMYSAAREGLVEKPADRPSLQGPHTPAPTRKVGV